ncbi:MAG TPA: hypothetical protein VFA00_04420 [Actinomycetota bacterium]|jgi:hypothetical protein|nr:hypothetical protein [Actinomycetota bacterium]
MTTSEADFAGVAARKVGGVKPKVWAFGVLTVLAAAITTALFLTSAPNETKSADEATSSFSFEGVQQARLLNGSPAASSIENHSPRGGRIEMASRWLQGLADGTILPTDVTSRLQLQHPKVARIVMAAWSASSSVHQGVLDARALNEPDHRSSGSR